MTTDQGREAGPRLSVSKKECHSSAARFRPDVQSPLRLFWRRFSRHRLALSSAMVFLLIATLAVAADIVAPTDPSYIDPDAFVDSPTSAHVLGTDRLGRDILSRLIYGGRVSLSVGVVAAAASMIIGTIMGSVAGYYAGWVDAIVSRLIDIVLSFPQLMIILVLVGLLGPGLSHIMLVLGLLGWPQVARIVRAEFMRLRNQEFILAAKVVGVPGLRIMLRHLLPNAMGPILVAATFGVANAVLMESSLSFFGLGVRPPTPSWGQMLSEAQSLTILEFKPWMWAPAGLMVVATVLSINFVGDGLRDALDPRLRR